MRKIISILTLCLLTCSLMAQPSHWAVFSQTATTNYAPLGASAVPVSVRVLTTQASAFNSVYQYEFILTNQPAWVQPGLSVKVSASTTVGGVSYDLSRSYTVNALVSSNAFTVVASQVPVGLQGLASTSTIDSGSGVVSNATVTLIPVAQKAMFSCTTGHVTLVPVVNGGAPYTIGLSSTSGEYEVTAPGSANFSLGDWSVSSTNSGVISVRFL
jgi:hypothetical protein